ncbi:hypothetical protein OF83DRAFT_1105391 [Amylostereum chailletii]|nr:hypothetical protein OF83DRAFT_1105391 [Amylostereum chailletii]
MLVRHSLGGNSKAPGLFLDFLIPHLSTHRNYGSIPSRDRAVPSRTDTKAKNSVIRGSARTPKRTPHPPSQSTKWDRPTAALSGRSPRTSSLPSMDTIDNTIAKLQQLAFDNGNSAHHRLRAFQDSMEQNRFDAAWKIWMELNDSKMLHAFGPSYIEMCSRIVAEYLSRNATLPASVLAKLEEMALYLASRRATEALYACLLAAVTRQDPEAALSLYERFVENWKTQVSRSDGIIQNLVKEEYDVDVDAEAATTPSLLAQISKGTESSDTLPRRTEILTIAILAHAMKDDFPSAIHAAINSPYLLYLPLANAVIQPLHLPPALHTKVHTYINHASTAVHASKPDRIVYRIQRMAASLNDVGLKTLYDLVVSGLGAEYPWSTVRPEDVSKNRPVLLTESVWINFIKAFIEVNKLDYVEMLWDDMVRAGHTPSVAVWTTLVQNVGSLRGVNYVLQMWKAMLAEGITPNSSTYQGLITTLLAERRTDEAMVKFEELLEAVQSTPSLSEGASLEPVYNTMINGFLARNCRDDAYALLERMKTNGPTPTVATYNTFMAHYHRHGDFKALSRVLKTISAEGLKGDAFTFSTLLCALLQILDRDEAIARTMGIMKKHDAKPNVVIYSAIIDNLLQEEDEGALRAALDVLRTMESSGDRNMEPNVVTYTTVLSAVHRWEGLDRQLAEECTAYITRRMREQRIYSNKVTYGILLKACLANRRPEGLYQALRYYREMRASKVTMTADTWYIILRGLAGRGEWGIANEVVDDMVEAKVTPSQWLILGHCIFH